MLKLDRIQEEIMENRRGILTHFSTLIRIVVILVLAVIIIFFAVQFFRNRQASQKAERVSQDSSQVSRSDDSQDETRDTEGQDSARESGDVPSGIADGDSSDGASSGSVAAPSALPGAGIDGGILLLGVALMAGTYFLALLRTNSASAKRSL